MSDDGTSWGGSVFRDEHVFDLGYLPEAFLHRDEQMETFKYALRPAVRGSRPLNVMARGPPGTGKTTAVQKMFDELTSVSDVEVARINCQVDSTRYAVFSRLFQGLFEYEPPTSGVSFKNLFGQITDRLVKEDEVLIVALDDVNYLFYEGEASDVLYSLLRAHEAHSGATIGVMVISSDLDLDVIDALDSRVQSVFRPEEVYFSAYGPREIVDILRERVERGFQEGAVDAQVLDQVADYTASSGGDLRIGIDLLKRAGLKAETRGSARVSLGDVDEAYSKAKTTYRRRHIRGLSDEAERLLRIVSIRDQSNEKMTEEAIKNEILEYSNIGYTEFSNILNTLEQLNLITTNEPSETIKGKDKEIKPVLEASEVLDILKRT